MSRNIIQQIFNSITDQDISKYNFPPNVLKAIASIQSCRTAVLGSHIDECVDCNHVNISYNSCRNRNCPSCQNISKEEWIEKKKSELINTQYFHVVFTLPDSLNTIIYSNQKIMYNIFFKSVSETLLELSLDEKYLGAQISLTTVLHTWGQNLSYHPHIHCIVPSGGLSLSGCEFKASSKKFFIPVKVLSKKFRGKFLYYLEKEIKNQTLKLPNKFDFNPFKGYLYTINWNVYCKETFKSPSNVIEYLGRYTHKVAITNNRIISFENNIVTFKYKNYKDNSKVQTMKLSSIEFVRRFLLHVLPKKFFKIRNYGISSNRAKKYKLKKCQILTGVKLHELQPLSRKEILVKLFGSSIFCCKKCGSPNVNRRFLVNDQLKE